MIEIRAPLPQDVGPVTALMNLPGVRAGTGRLPFTPEALVEKRLFQAGPRSHPLVATYDEKVAGHSTLRQRDGRQAHAGDVYLLVGDPFWGQGIGRALMDAMIDLADRWLGLRRLQLEVFVENERAVKLYEAFGFEIEGRLRSDTLVDGTLADSYVMGRLIDPPPREYPT
ncbi:MAG: GNAT family N-acetyltransferase [Pseudomonadota bacterium]